jgi:hypothetical protein
MNTFQKNNGGSISRYRTQIIEETNCFFIFIYTDIKGKWECNNGLIILIWILDDKFRYVSLSYIW